MYFQEPNFYVGVFYKILFKIYFLKKISKSFYQHLDIDAVFSEDRDFCTKFSGSKYFFKR